MLFTDTGNARFGIWEIPLDAEKGRSRGEPRRLSPGRRNESYPYLAENGRSLAFLVWEADSASLRVQDSMTGKERILANIGAVESFGAFVVSRDSRWVSYRITDRKEQQVFVVPFQGGPPRKVCGNCGRATDWTQDGRYLVAHDLSGSENKIGLIDVQSGRTRVLLEGSQRMYGARLSPDGKWLVFSVLPAGDKKRRNCIVPFDPGKPVPEGDWVDLFDTLQEERWLRWSPHGDMLYFLRTAGGRSSVWAVRMNLQTGMAVGDPTEVYQPSELRTAISGDPAAIAITLAADRLILTLTELQSNLWLAEQQR
jgi:Tol biopolymer transport system component